MKLKLWIHKSWCLAFDTSAQELEYNITEEELKDFQDGYLTLYPSEDWGIIKEMNTELKNQTIKDKKIAEYKAIEKKATEARAEYLTAELLPESPLKTMKLAKLETQRTEIETEFNTLVTSLVEEYWEEILSELI